MLVFFITTKNKNQCSSLQIFRNKGEIKNSLDSIICFKSKDNGMQLIINSLTQKEYNYLSAKSSILPPTPFKSDSIKIKYFRDDFLGDYGLEITIKVLKNNFKLPFKPVWHLNGSKLLNSDKNKDTKHMEFYYYIGKN